MADSPEYRDRRTALEDALRSTFGWGALMADDELDEIISELAARGWWLTRAAQPSAEPLAVDVADERPMLDEDLPGYREPFTGHIGAPGDPTLETNPRPRPEVGASLDRKPWWPAK